MTVAGVLSAGIAVAGPIAGGATAWLAAAAMGQTTAVGAPEDKNAQAADLLRRARQAMEESNFSAADSLIARAEALDIRYGPFYFGDTPKKARRDLERRRAAAVPLKPSHLSLPFGLSKADQAPSADPFAGRSARPPAQPSNPAQVTLLPKVDSAGPGGSLSAPASPAGPFGGLSGALPGENDIRTPGSMPAIPYGVVAANAPNPASAPGSAMGPSPRTVAAAGRPVAGQMGGPAAAPNRKSPLCRARLALAVGDVRRAALLVQQARAAATNYQPLDDTPDKVEAAIHKYSELQTLDKSTEAYRRAYARNLTEQADALLRWNERDEAERLASRAAAIPIMYGPFEARPQDLLERIRELRQGRLPGSAATTANGPYPVRTAGGAVADQSAASAVYNPAADQTRNVQAADQQPAPPLGPALPGKAEQPDLRVPQVPPETMASQTPASTPASRKASTPSSTTTSAKARVSALLLFEQGEVALKAHDTDRAYHLFLQAAARSNELDPATAQQLQDKLQALSVSSRTRSPGAAAPNLIDEAAAKQRLLARQVAAELANQESLARAMRPTNPTGALALLEEAKKKVVGSAVDAVTKARLLRRVDQEIAETQQFIAQNRPQIELAEKNNNTRQEIERERKTKVVVREKVALLVNECNRLMDEQRFEEAQVVAKQAADLDPKNPVVTQLLWQTKFVQRYMNAKSIEDQKEQGFVDTLAEVDKASIPFASDKNPMVFTDARSWSKLTASRRKYGGDARPRRTEQEIEIEKKLRTPVSLQFTNAPLSKVTEYLGKLAGISLYLDPQGLAEEGQTGDTPVTIDIRQEIMLKSALNLILEPLHLSYVVKDEVLKITSEQMRDGQMYQVTYNVADLVVPIPNFVPQAFGSQAALNGALANMNLGGGGLTWGSASAMPMSVANRGGAGAGGGLTNASFLAQQMTNTPRPGGMPGGKTSPTGAGPGGLGGSSGANPDQLIDLITSTIKPDSWASAGGAAPDPQFFDLNLSLVITQTQEVHEMIAELLEQLRRLQDLQVTVEVRFITLNDNFFERVGVSFDFDIGTNTQGSGVQILSQSTSGNATGATTTTSDRSRAITVGMSSPTSFTSDLDIPFTQNSFGLAVPQFGGFDASAGASLGFAILSNIEAYFFINAAQGDRRSNVLQAPKVTLFNGQMASVMDMEMVPFVMGVIPVVGDFAAAQQPVVVVLSEGTYLGVQAVVSADRRFVRLTVVPVFSNIGAVNTFTFEGSQTTTTNSSQSGLQPQATDPSKLWNQTSNATSSSSSGTTIQLPTFATVTVMTTVSVPDGGTILLGGIKRLSEGRNEFGVPGLDKIPYLNRLFRNVAIGRETSSLMMMVTPRIIIEEEEEEKLGTPPPPE